MELQWYESIQIVEHTLYIHYTDSGWRIPQVRILHILREKVPPGIYFEWWNMFIHGHPSSSGHWGHRLHTNPDYQPRLRWHWDHWSYGRPNSLGLRLRWHSPLGFSGHHWGQWPCVNPWTKSEKPQDKKKNVMCSCYCCIWIRWKSVLWLDTFQICYSMIVKILFENF